MHLPLLQDILILLGFAVIVVLILQRFRIPSILGFLITGIIIGPYGLSLIREVHQIEIISEIGVILLLFVIGMELSIKQLLSIRKTVFIGGFLQVGLTVVVTMLIYRFLGFEWNQAVFVGFLFSLSSTAIVLKILQDRNEITAPQGRNALGILIFQDIIVVPMILVTPMLAGESTEVWLEILDLLFKTAVIVVVTYVSARYLVPRLMHAIARTNSKELFLLSTITICFAVAFLTSEVGLSLALGAFLAGLIISESEYSHQATSTILPFRELFTSFFFVSVGMLLNLQFFTGNIGFVLLLVLLIFLLKGTIASIAIACLKYPPRTVILTGLSLFQVGEFAFILSKVGIEYGLLNAEMNQYFLSASLVTMFFTPFVIQYSDKISNLIIHPKIQKKWGSIPSKLDDKQQEYIEQLDNHLIIVGFGINGRNVARAARFADIPYVILELHADTVRNEKSKGEPIIFGDATQDHILDSVKLKKARVVVIAISDPQGTKTVLSNIRHISQSVFVVVRTRQVKEINELIALGADEVIPEEFETSVEIFSRVLHNYLVPEDIIEKLIVAIRADNYKMFLSQSRLPRTFRPTQLPDFKITCVRLMADSGNIVGKKIKQSKIRQNFGVNILAITRNGDMISNITPEDRLHQHDLVFITGDQEQIDRFYHAVS